MAIRIRNIDHVVLRVTNIERSLAFYGEVLGCTLDRPRPELGLYHLRAGSAFVDLVDINGPMGRGGEPPADMEGHNMDHVALKLEEFDEIAIRAHLAAHDVAVSPMMQVYGAEGDGPAFYIDDPDGNTIELKGRSRG